MFTQLAKSRNTILLVARAREGFEIVTLIATKIYCSVVVAILSETVLSKSQGSR